jgi:tetratricopeptide (TPR) repeat protein
LQQARIAARTGRFDDVLTILAKVDPAEIKRPETQQDMAFYKAFAAARMALAGNGSTQEAGKQLMAFEKANPNSYHYFAACETIGDLLAAMGRVEQAEPFYARLAKSANAEYQLRGGVLLGRALVARKDYDGAIKKFDEVAAMRADGKQADALRQAALVGKAAALCGLGKTDEGIKLTEEVIAKADEDQTDLHARAYNVQGNCYLAADKKKEALIAFLHVDVLFAGAAEQHAEALAHLATLWKDVDKSDRAQQAQAQLKQRYPNSSWAQK